MRNLFLRCLIPIINLNIKLLIYTFYENWLVKNDLDLSNDKNVFRFVFFAIYISLRNHIIRNVLDKFFARITVFVTFNRGLDLSILQLFDTVATTVLFRNLLNKQQKKVNYFRTNKTG